MGHRNPDTDAICSAIGYAEFKKQMGFKKVVAARCGDINDRISFVLRYFGVAPPRFVGDVRPKVRDVMQHQVSWIGPDATSGEAFAMMERGNIRVLPIVDDERYCHGLISVFKMGQFLLTARDRESSSRRVLASIQALVRNLQARIVFGIYTEREEDSLLMVAAMDRDTFEERLRAYPPEKLIVVVGNRRSIQELAIKHRVRAVVVTGNLDVDDEVVHYAQQNEVNLLVSPHDSATTVMLCRSAISVEHIKHEHFLTFREDESLSAIQDVAVASQFQAFPVLDAHRRVVGVLSKTDLLKRVDRKLILVDHNEISQAVKGADQVEIIEIIDHHRIGAFTSHQPMLFMNRPVGSTSTIVADLFFTYGCELNKQVAGLLLAGLVSDTLNLTSPTTTEVDATVLRRLAEISEINPEAFTEKLFSSGSVLTGLPVDEAIVVDCKEYTEAGKRFSVAQIEEIGFKRFWERHEPVMQALEAYRMSNNYHFSSLLVTDVVRQTSLLLIAGPKDYLSRIHYPMAAENVFELSGVVSRKKQLLPYLVRCLEHLMNGPKSALASRSANEIVASKQELIRNEDSQLSILMAAVEDHDVHEVLQRSEEILDALAKQRERKNADVAGLVVCEMDGESGVLLIGTKEESTLSRLDLPKLNPGIFSLGPSARSKAAVAALFSAANLESEPESKSEPESESEDRATDDA